MGRRKGEEMHGMNGRHGRIRANGGGRRGESWRVFQGTEDLECPRTGGEPQGGRAPCGDGDG